MSDPDAVALAQACTVAGLDSRSAVLLRRHANAVYLLPKADVVARVGLLERLDQARLTVAVTRWLVARGFPATVPLDIEQPVPAGDQVVTFWRYYPQGDHGLPPVRELAGIVRELHSAEPPPFRLPEYQPLESFRTALTRHGQAVLNPEEFTWLRQRQNDLLRAYAALDSHLGHGLIHGDTRTGNLLWSGTGAVLGDWDSVSIGPRELDVITTYQGIRYGRSDEVLDEFASIYGWDIRTWPGFETLRDLRDLHTLSAPLRLAAYRPDVATELRHRLDGLRTGNLRQQWRGF